MVRRNDKTVVILGIIGGIGSGKSTVARMLADKGAILIDADKIASSFLGDQKIKEEIVEEFGESVLDAQGNVYRTYLAHAVFESKKILEKLNKILHPRIAAELDGDIGFDPASRRLVGHETGDCSGRKLGQRHVMCRHIIGDDSHDRRVCLVAET